MRFLLILIAAAAVYLSIHTLKQHGVEPAAKDFWICQGSAIAAGVCAVLSVCPKKKKEGK